MSASFPHFRRIPVFVDDNHFHPDFLPGAWELAQELVGSSATLSHFERRELNNGSEILDWCSNFRGRIQKINGVSTFTIDRGDKLPHPFDSEEGYDGSMKDYLVSNFITAEVLDALIKEASNRNERLCSSTSTPAM